MIPKEIIQKILEAGVQAPSGENCQPWCFDIADNKIRIFNIPERDTSLYNVSQLGSFVAHGALIENISIKSASMGYSCSIELFPNTKDKNHVADLTLIESEKDQEELSIFISERSSNRHPYLEKKLTQEHKLELEKSLQGINDVEIRLIENKESRKNLAKYLVASDRILFENEKVHDFLFSHIIWNKMEAENKKSGFYIKELALPLLVEKIFKILRNWNKVLLLNKFGFSKFAAQGNVKLYSKGSAIVSILVNNNRPADFISAGRAMQRFWLFATKMGLSMQPITGVLFFNQRVLANQAQDFSNDHIELIKQSYSNICKIIETKEKTIAMIFRIGWAIYPAIKSNRLPPIYCSSKS